MLSLKRSFRPGVVLPGADKRFAFEVSLAMPERSKSWFNVDSEGKVPGTTQINYHILSTPQRRYTPSRCHLRLVTRQVIPRATLIESLFNEFHVDLVVHV